MAANKYTTITRVLRIAVVILFAIGILIVGFYKVPNQGITMIINTNEGKQSYYFTPDELESLDNYQISISGRDNIVIKEICFYRLFKTVCVDKIVSSSVGQYINISSNEIVIEKNAMDLMQKLSKTVLMERMIIAETLLAIAVFLWILVDTFSEKFNPANKGNHGPIKEIGRFFKDISRYGQYMNYAAKADLNAEVANSYLNRLWWLLEPFFNMLVYVIVFGKLMGNSIENYATFVFSALLMWSFFAKTINYSVKCIRGNRDIVTKVYVPKHVLLISNMILNFYKLLFSLIVLVPMLLIFRVQIGLGTLWLIPAYILMIIFSFGVGMFLLHYGVYIDDLGYAVGILLQMLMFLSGVFYDAISGLTFPLNVMMLVLNPVAMFIDTMRNALLYNKVSNIPLIIIWLILSLLISYMGIHLVYKNENGYVKVV